MLRKQVLLRVAQDAATAESNVPTPKAYPRKSSRGPSLYVKRLEQRIENQEQRIRGLEDIVRTLMTKIQKEC